jgi:hypothetical protein
MYRITKVVNGAFPAAKDDRLGIVWGEPSWFCVYPDEVKGFPHFFDEFVDVKPFAGGYRNAIRNFVTWVYQRARVREACGQNVKKRADRRSSSSIEMASIWRYGSCMVC